MFASANASKADSGTRCSPVRRTRPEKRPSKNANARFSVSRSGNVTVTMVQPPTDSRAGGRSQCNLGGLPLPSSPPPLVASRPGAVSSPAMPTGDYERFRQRLEEQLRAEMELLYEGYRPKLRAYE